MKPGKAFEILVKYILLSIGFLEVKSDDYYVFDSLPLGQVVQGLGGVHDADVLIEPPVQIPFCYPTRLVIECKDHKEKVGLGILRNALGLREDINHFEVVDKHELKARIRPKVKVNVHKPRRYYYQVAVASLSGFTIPAQNFAAAHRISLIEFDKMPFWIDFIHLIESHGCYFRETNTLNFELNAEFEYLISRFAENIGDKMAVAITNSGQLLFLYRIFSMKNAGFGDEYHLHWAEVEGLWKLKTEGAEYVFQLPENIAKEWLDGATTELNLRKKAIDYKADYFSNMVVYYKEHGKPMIKMISIDRYWLEKAKRRLE